MMGATIYIEECYAVSLGICQKKCQPQVGFRSYRTQIV